VLVVGIILNVATAIVLWRQGAVTRQRFWLLVAAAWSLNAMGDIFWSSYVWLSGDGEPGYLVAFFGARYLLLLIAVWAPTRRYWPAALLALLAGLVIWVPPVIVTGSSWDDAFYPILDVVLLCGVGLCWRGQHGLRRDTWTWLALAMGLYALGNWLTYSIRVLGLALDPSVATLCWTSSHLPLLAALWSERRQPGRTSRHTLGAVLAQLVYVSVSDPDDARRRRLLNILVLATLGCLVVGLAVTVLAQFMYPDDPGGWDAMYAAIAIAAVFCIGVLALTHVHRPWAGLTASSLYLGLLLMLAPMTDVPMEVVAGRSMVWFVIPILAASFLLRPWASLVLCAASGAVVIVLAATAEIPIMPNLFGLLVFFAIALVAWLAARGLEGALAQVRHEEGLRLAAEQARAAVLEGQALVLEQRVQERTAELRALNEQQRQFLDAVSHDMRSPLQGAMLWGEILQDEEDLPGQYHDHVKQINFALGKLSTLIDDILDLARLGYGQITSEMQDIPDLGALVEEALRILQPQIDAAGLIVRVDIPGHCLRGDPQQLARVLLNLLSNAVKYSPPGGTVTCSARVADGQYHLQVTDAGIGIPAGELETVFQPMKRSTRSTGIKGFGLGLPISRQLVELHGGRIWAQSAGSGSTFHVALPLPGPDESTVDLALAESALTKGRVLVVDDHESVRLAFRTALEQGGYTVVTATTGAEALAAVRSQRPRLVLLDLLLPDMAGEEVLRTIRQDPDADLAATPVIVVSVKLENLALRGLVSAYLTKPVNVSRLLTTIEQVLQRRPRPARNILVIDDDVTFGRAMQDLLGGYTVHVVHDGTSGLARILQEPAAVALVILDVVLPDMNGWAILAQLTQLDDPPPVIVISGVLTDAAAQAYALHCGANQFLTKPMEPGTIRQAVEAILA
ncbi:MAG: response regulator, partial [Chloroflexi bacterium]|nr:response regulator [Chloroflexota bacterium]